MHEVMARGGAQPSWQPAAHVRTPMNFLKGDVVKGETRENASRPDAVKEPLREQKWNGIGEEKRDDSPRVAGKVDVTRGVRRVQRGVVHHVLLAKDAGAGVQQESVQAIFKSIRVEKTDQETGGEPCKGMREKMERNEYKDRAGQKCSKQVISFCS